MSELEFYDAGFDELAKMLEDFMKEVENPEEILAKGADALAEDVRKLPKPRSSVNKAGYTHLLDTVTWQKEKKEVKVGWGKYYGRMVENGTHLMRAQPHLLPTFERNKEKYYKLMTGGLFNGD